jgi:hypothetical protein
MSCKHEKRSFRDKTFANGTKHVEEYCTECGAWVKWVKQNSPITDSSIVYLKKHKGKTYLEVFNTDLDYLKWVASKDFQDEDLRNKVREYLKSKGVVIE